MSKSHNKKRNTGLLYEFLIASVSRALVQGDKRRSAAALRIIRRHFKPGTELYKEFRLVNALMRTTVSSPTVAGNILQEAKLAAREHNVNELDRQKSLLIRDINHVIKDDDFYDQQVGRYRMLATVQTLVNDWRSPERDLERIALYEDQMATWLTSPKETPADGLISETSPGESRLLMKVMMKKLNEKYAGVLNEDQRALVRAYAFSTASDDQMSLRMKLEEIKGTLLESIVQFKRRDPENQYINAKLDTAQTQLLAETFDVVDDGTVTRFMLYTKLAAELTAEETDDA